MAGDRVEVDQGGGPCGLQSGLGAADVAAFAGALAVREQAEEAFDPGACSSQVLGSDGVLERSSSGLK
jgi:hypothetical protein